jgi:hypothetical protein
MSCKYITPYRDSTPFDLGLLEGHNNALWLLDPLLRQENLREVQEDRNAPILKAKYDGKGR